MWPLGALACDTRTVARGAAEFNSCETPWVWSSGDGAEDLYLCASDICPRTTVLRFSLRDIAEADLGKDHDQLMREWTETALPKDFDGYKIEMLDQISIVEIGENRGVLIPSKLTAPDGTVMSSFAFRVPLEKHYVVANATGEAEPDVIRKSLDAAVEHLAIAKDAGQ